MLYVGKGPAVVGEFLGYDLKASFQSRTPVPAGRLPADAAVSASKFASITKGLALLAAAQRELKKRRCEPAKVPLDEAALLAGEHHHYFEVLDDYHACRGENTAAKTAWSKAMELHPPYLAQRLELEKKLNQ